MYNNIMKNFIIILLLSIILLSSIVIFNQKWISQEGFTPALRRIYRPYLRSARVTTESFYSNKSTDISNMFRRFGIM